MNKISTPFLLLFLSIILFAPAVKADELTNDDQSVPNSRQQKVLPRKVMGEANTESQEGRLTPPPKTGLIKEGMQNIRTQYKEASEQARTEFKQKLTLIKDTRKKATVEQLDTNIQQINTRSTTTMTNSLTKLETILTKLTTKATLPENQIVLNDLRAKITATQQSVTTQASKQYVISVTDETKLGQSVKTTLGQLRSDLKVVHEQVVETKKAVVQYLRELSKSQKMKEKVASPEAMER